METITDKMLEKRVEAIAGFMRDLGLMDGEEVAEWQGALRYPHLVLQKGSKARGMAYRLHLSGGSVYGSGWSEVPGLSWGYLGSNKREAWQTLEGLWAGLFMATILRDRSKRIEVVE